jgi:hypothetical protein
MLRHAISVIAAGAMIALSAFFAAPTASGQRRDQVIKFAVDGHQVPIRPQQ